MPPLGVHKPLLVSNYFVSFPARKLADSIKQPSAHAVSASRAVALHQEKNDYQGKHSSLWGVSTG